MFSLDKNDCVKVKRARMRVARVCGFAAHRPHLSWRAGHRTPQAVLVQSSLYL